MPSRHFRSSIPGFEDSYAMLSESEAAETAVVFVHGYGGNARGTWLQFQTLVDVFVDQFPWWEHCDLFFFAYDSISSPIKVSSTRLLSFLSTIYPRPKRTLFQTRPLRDFSYLSADFSVTAFRKVDHLYKRLLLIGHSEGCVVIRKAVLDTAHAIALRFCAVSQWSLRQVTTNSLTKVSESYTRTCGLQPLRLGGVKELRERLVK